MPSKILDSRGNPIRSLDRGPRRTVLARYDSAGMSDDTRNWWANADNLSAKAANSREVREKLRNRTRYEVANGSYPDGIANTLAVDLVGTGPRLQLTTDSRDFNVEVEARWREWASAVCLPEKLRTMRRARAVDGESFALLETNRGLPTPSKLDVRVIEADQVADPYGMMPEPMSVDGIALDKYGRPVSYSVLRGHPGDDYQLSPATEYRSIPARYVLHWFRATRPMQYRGVPEFTPALDLFAKLRRYTLAVIASAELVANFSLLLETNLPADVDEDDPDAATAASVTPFTSTEIARGVMTALPAGQKMAQPKAEQPATTFEMFEVRILKQICRCLGVPYFMATGDYADINFSSGRLGAQGYFRDVDVNRSHAESVILDPVFGEWYRDMVARGQFDADEAMPAHQWLWTGFAYFDPLKEANATATLLGNYLTSFTEECQKQGVDPETRLKTIKSDLEMFERLGIPNPYTAPAAAPQGTPAVDPRKAAATNGRAVHSGNGRH